MERFEISYDQGRTWRPLPRGFQQDGRFTAGPNDIAIQSLGRGREVWYRIVEREE